MLWVGFYLDLHPPTAHCLLAQLARHTQEQGQWAGGPQGHREGERLLNSGLLRPWAPCTLPRCGRTSALMLVVAGVSALAARPHLPAPPPSLPSTLAGGCLLTQKHTPPPTVSLGKRTKVTTAHIYMSHRIPCPPASQSPGHPRDSDSASCVHLELGCVLLGGLVLGCLEPHQPLQTQPLVLPGPQPSAKLLSPPLVRGLSTVAHPSWRTVSSGASVAPEGRILTGDVGRGAGSTLTPALPPPLQRSPHPDPWNPALMWASDLWDP